MHIVQYLIMEQVCWQIPRCDGVAGLCRGISGRDPESSANDHICANAEIPIFVLGGQLLSEHVSVCKDTSAHHSVINRYEQCAGQRADRLWTWLRT